MRTIKEIVLDINTIATAKNEDALWLEWFRAVADEISPARLQTICEAERNETCAVLPYKVGDTVWKIKSAFSYFTKPMEDRVDRIIIDCNETIACCTSGIKFSVDRIGKTVFLTREEAEAVLKNKEEV